MKLHFAAHSWLTALISWMLLTSGVCQDDKSCACAAQESGFVIDCSNQVAMEDAEAALTTNDCNTDCSTEICRRTYLLIQSHHDYCFSTEVPSSLGVTLHLYEDTCGHECVISGKADPSLPDCPQVSCDDDAGNEAYAALADAGCTSNCTNDFCGPYFRTLMVVHDNCPEDTLDITAEAAFHAMEEDCQPLHGCNIVAGDDAENPLVCLQEDSAAAGGTMAVALLGAVLMLSAWVL